MTINGLTSSIELSLDLTAGEVVSITPSSVNPVVAQTLDIILDVSEFEMLSENFDVKLVLKELSNPNHSYRSIKNERPLNIVGVYSPSRTLSVKFGGSPGGVYDVVVSSSQGKLVSSITLTTEVEVLDF